MTPLAKFMSLNKMVQDFVADGNLVYIEGILANRSPMAIIHEIIRKGRQNLRIISAPNGIAIDQLIGANCVNEIEFYFLGFMTQTGFAPMRRFRSAVEARKLKVKESMGYAICMGLRAGAYGIPFIPLPDFRGSDLLNVRKDYKIMNSPYNPNDTVIVVPALQPDILLLHAHYADTDGNIVLDEPWPIFTLTTAQACQKVIVTVEEIIESKTLKAHQITIPHFLVDAIAHVPYGAAPTALNRRYEVDYSHIMEYQESAKTARAFTQYLQEYVLECASHKDFLKKTGLPPSWVIKSQTKGYRVVDRG